MKSTAIDNCLYTNYTTYGDGRPVVLIHGVAASLYDWASLAPELAANAYRAIAPDLLGHGESAKPQDAACYHIEAIYTHLAGWLDDLHLDQPVILVGHSLGGYLSLLHALRAPQKVAAAVLINPLFSPKQLSPLLNVVRRRPDISARLVRKAPLWLIDLALGWDPINASVFDPQVRKQIAYDYKRASPYFVHVAGDIPDLSSQLGSITQPVQLIYGDLDMTLNPHSFPSLARLLPNAATAVISGSGHQPHIGYPTRVNRLVLEFLNGVVENG